MSTGDYTLRSNEADFRADVEGLMEKYGRQDFLIEALGSPEDLGAIMRRAYRSNFNAYFCVGVVALICIFIGLFKFDGGLFSPWPYLIGLGLYFTMLCFGRFRILLKAINELHNIGLKHLIPFHPPGRWWVFYP